MYLIIGELEPRLLAVGENLPQDDAEAPYIALGGEFAVHYAFRRHPANRKHRMTANLLEYAGKRGLDHNLTT